MLPTEQNFTFIEVFPSESSEHLRAAVRGLLAPLNYDPQPRFGYSFGKTVQWQQSEFRDFLCLAGSLHILIRKLAREGWSRRIIALDWDWADVPSESFSTSLNESFKAEVIHQGKRLRIKTAEIIGLRTPACLPPRST